MSDRPKWAKQTALFVSDTIIDYIDQDGADDDITDELEALVKAWLCDKFGHEIEDDQCNIPAHRYCVHCGLRETTIVASTPENVETST